MKRPEESREEFQKRIDAKAERKMRARTEHDRSLWFGLGTMGVVGWSVSVPTLIGAAVGRWLDARYQDTISWTLMLLLIGVGLGSINAYHWVNQHRERLERHDDDE
jgi:ATP synthase protein I